MFKVYKTEASYRLIDILYDRWLFNQAVGAVGLGMFLLGITELSARVFAESYIEYPKFTIGLLIFFGICSIGGILPEQEKLKPAYLDEGILDEEV